MLLVTIKILFWFSIIALLHTYILYPFIVNIFAKNKELNKNTYSFSDKLPSVSVIMAVRNSDLVIEKKIKSIFHNDYPNHNIEFLIGSDASDDNTSKIITSCMNQFPNIKFTEYNNRVGKVHIINELSLKAKNDILIFTDAHAIPKENTIFQLVKHFKDSSIAVVCSNLLNSEVINQGVSVQEDIYLKSEIKLKYNEGILWEKLIGAYGAFFAVRNSEFEKVPDNFLVDDFFISFNVLVNGKKSILEPKAIVHEKISGNVNDEFKRKIRISTGNFQNLKKFAHILLSKDIVLSFSFFSHKVLRWFGPVFILLIIISSILLQNQSLFYQFFAVLLFFSLITPIIDYLLRKYGIHIILLRFISHYYYMNLGLFIGLLKYIKGVKTNVWEPTKRESKP